MTMAKQKKLYGPGDTVTYRLGKNDNDIADFLNQQDKPAAVHKEALRLLMSASGHLMPSGQEVSCPELQDMNERVKNIECVLQDILERLKGLPAAGVVYTGEPPETAATTDSGASNEEIIDDEEIKAALDSLADFD